MEIGNVLSSTATGIEIYSDVFELFGEAGVNRRRARWQSGAEDRQELKWGGVL